MQRLNHSPQEVPDGGIMENVDCPILGKDRWLRPRRVATHYHHNLGIYHRLAPEINSEIYFEGG